MGKKAVKTAPARTRSTPKPKAAIRAEVEHLVEMAEEMPLRTEPSIEAAPRRPLPDMPPSAPPQEPPAAVQRSAQAIEIGRHLTEEDMPPATRDIHFFAPGNLDRAVFCRQLATLIEVGIPLLRALQMLSRRTSHPRLAHAISAVARKVEGGQSFSDAMTEHEPVFSSLVVSSIRVGEAGGILEDSLIRLAQIMEARADLNRKVSSALWYPGIALFVAACVIYLVLTKAVPAFASVYADVNEELPGATKVVIALGDALAGTAWRWVILVALLGVAWRYFGRSEQGRMFKSRLALRLPIFSMFTRKIAVARFCRTVSGLVSAGVPLVEAVKIASETNENAVVAAHLAAVQASLERGEKMSRPLGRANIFPPMVVDMISIGEETGTLDKMLTKIADIYDSDVDSSLRGLSTIIEPVLIVLLGGIVIFIALAVMLPYFNLISVV